VLENITRFFSLRYKIATEHLEKGLLFLKREVKFEVHSWPGTDDIIPETTRNGLQVGLLQTFVVICAVYKCWNEQGQAFLLWFFGFALSVIMLSLLNIHTYLLLTP